MSTKYIFALELLMTAFALQYSIETVIMNVKVSLLKHNLWAGWEYLQFTSRFFNLVSNVISYFFFQMK